MYEKPEFGSKSVLNDNIYAEQLLCKSKTLLTGEFFRKFKQFHSKCISFLIHPEVRGQRLEVRSRKSGVGGQKSEVCGRVFFSNELTSEFSSFPYFMDKI